MLYICKIYFLKLSGLCILPLNSIKHVIILFGHFLLIFKSPTYVSPISGVYIFDSVRCETGYSSDYIGCFCHILCQYHGSLCKLYIIVAIGYLSHYENMPMQYTEIFKLVKMKIFRRIFKNIFLIFAQNIDCGYTLEHNEYPQFMLWSKNKKKRCTPANPSFFF